MVRWGVSHTGASIVRAEVQICGPDPVTSVTTHGEAKDRPTQSAWDVGMRRKNCQGGERRGQREWSPYADRQTARYVVDTAAASQAKLTACVSDVNRGLDVSSR